MRFVSCPGNSRCTISSPCRASAPGGSMPTSVAPRWIRVNGEPSSKSAPATGSRIFHGWAVTDLFAEAAHDEQRIVDGDGQPDHGHDVRGEDGDGAHP